MLGLYLVISALVYMIGFINEACIHPNVPRYIANILFLHWVFCCNVGSDILFLFRTFFEKGGDIYKWIEENAMSKKIIFFG